MTVDRLADLTYTDLVQAKTALKKFLQSTCTDKFFVYQSPDPNPVENCLCWHEFDSLSGGLRASVRFTLLEAAFFQPFSCLKIMALKLFGAKVHKSAYISPRCFIDTLYPTLLVIEEGVLLGVEVGIGLHEHAGNIFRAGRIIIRRGATIGAGARIGCGVEIGEFAEVGGGAVVMRDVPARAKVIGNPARIISRIQNSEKVD